MPDGTPQPPCKRSLLARIGAAAVEERERWFLWSPVLVGTGAAVYFALPSEPPLWVGSLSLVAFAAIALAILRGRSLAEANQTALLLVLALVAGAAGFAAAEWRAARVAAPILDRQLGPVTVVGRLIAVEKMPAGFRITLDDLGIKVLPKAETPARIRLRLRAGGDRLRPGDRLRLSAILSPIPPPVAPGAFDFQRQSFFQGLGALGVVVGEPEVLPAQPAGVTSRLVEAIARLRMTIAATVRAHVSGAKGEMIVALIVGEQTGLPAPVMAAIRDAGLAHLLSISGLHIGMVGGFLFFWVRAMLAAIPWLCLRVPIKKVAALAALVGAGFYVLLADASVPTQRSFFMLAIVMVAMVFDRRAISMRLLAWAALIIVLTQPEALLGPSFQMSFAAMAALIALYEESSRRHRGHPTPSSIRRAALYLASILLSTVVATLATAPFAIYHFNRLAVFGALTNIIAIPLTGFLIMPAAVLAVALMPFGLEGVALTPMAWGTEAIIRLAQWAAAFPAAAILVPVLPMWGLALITLGGLWLCLWRRGWRLAGLAGIVLGFAGMATVSPPDVLIDGNGKLIAVKLTDGRLALSSAASGGFARKSWSQRSGESEPGIVWPKEGAAIDGERLRCDPLGCIYRAGGHTIAFPRRPFALLDDCRRADVVVTPDPLLTACPSAVRIIDGARLAREGTHTLWLDRPQIRIESVNAGRGRRPWVHYDDNAADEDD